jgi:hypothetical protein
MTSGSLEYRFLLNLNRLKDRQLFTTLHGRIGLTLKGVQPENLVCVFNHASLPHVIRRVKGTEHGRHKLVGDAYVHGLMYGAADEMDLEVRDITLV